MEIGKQITQTEGFKAFVPSKFPPEEPITMGSSLIQLLNKATLNLGKLDGITQTLPDLDFFIFMYVRKEAALSSKIEGTQATMIDSLKAELNISSDLPNDVNDIQHYIQAMNFGLNKLKSLPLSLRLIKEVHKVLLTDGRSSHFSSPGEFRESQNWIGGATPQTAKFVPPPVHEMKRALGDFEIFMQGEDELPPLIKTGLSHAQFETVHPFLDGNGRTGRLLITFYLCEHNILEKPVLYLSEFLKKNREVYFDLLHNYHNKGEVIPWLQFFLEGVNDVALKAIETSKKINALRIRDIKKVQEAGRSPKSALAVLDKLYELPIVNVAKIEEWTGFNRSSANKLVEKLVNVGILRQKDPHIEYGRIFEYKEYLDVFTRE